MNEASIPDIDSPHELHHEEINARQMWANNRFYMEAQNRKAHPRGKMKRHHWYALLWMMKAFELGVKITGLFHVGYRNAYDIQFRELDIVLEDLPAVFDGFKILHLSDLHLDGMPGLEDIILERIDKRVFDICVLTGDYRTELHGPIKRMMASMARLLGDIQTKRGILGILGNHDDVHMVAPMEALGVRMLINEKFLIEKEGQTLQFIGTDDVHYYYTDLALHALEDAQNHCTIALVHSPEVFDAAAEMGVDLYLCGHTHGGQVCFPGGIPLVTHLNHGRPYYKGLWQYEAMQGITNLGAGTSGIPVRFYTRGEVLSITLRCPS